MTAISSVGNLSVNMLPGATKLATTAAAVDTLQTTVTPSTMVTLTQAVTAAPVYSLASLPTVPSQAESQGTLNVKTASGALVELSKAKDGSGIQITVKQGNLSEAERSALEKLSDGFNKAMEGLTDQPPRLDLSGLTKFNTAVLKSVDLSAKVEGDNALTLTFHADSTTRSVNATGKLGTVDISVDISKRAMLGNENQQQRALSQYLKQFDRAQRRGEGDSTLMAMFKDAFTALNSNVSHSATTAANSWQQTNVIQLTRSDKNMLTGLADFTASVTQMPASINQMRMSESSTFSYQVSQSTTISGTSDLNRTILQQQQAHLTASYRKPLVAGFPVNLTTDKTSQNYFFMQIDDQAESTTNVLYRKGVLASATLDQSASSATRVQKYVKGERMSDTTTPVQKSTSTDLHEKLRSAWEEEDPRVSFADYLRQHTLPDFGEEVLLKSDPYSL